MSNPYQSPPPTQEPERWTATVLPWICLAGTSLAAAIAWFHVETSNVADYFASGRIEPPHIDFFLLRTAAWSGLLSSVPATAYFILSRKRGLVTLAMLVLLVVGMAHGLFSLWFLMLVAGK